VPDRFVAEGLVDALAAVPVGRALIARAASARDVLPDALRERGAEVDVLAVYETVVEPLDSEQLAAVAAADYLTFTASSTVTNFLAAFDDRDGVLADAHRRPRIVSIGPVTTGTLREHGLEPDVEASTHDIDGLIEALVADVGLR
jgi:uroporphyrinogen III methyltransferase/synthase